jgi:Transmembrane secretion effector
MQMASSNTIVQSIVDDRNRGRVLSLFVMARRGIESLGSLLFGAIAAWVGTPGTLMLAGTLCLLAVAAFATKLPSIRQAGNSFGEDTNRAQVESLMGECFRSDPFRYLTKSYGPAVDQHSD